MDLSKLVFLLSENKGFISTAHIRNALGEDLSSAELEAMIDAGDSSGTRTVTKGDLVALWRRMWEQRSHLYDHK